MFTTIFYFIIVFSLFSFYETQGIPALSPVEAVLCVLAVYACFISFTGIRFRRFALRYALGAARAETFSTAHAAVINQCMVYAVILYALFIYILDIKYFITAMPVLAKSSTAQNMIGLLLFFIFLIIIWCSAFPSYRSVYNTGSTLPGYLASHLRLNGSIVAPWLIFTLALDMIDALPAPVAALFKQNEAVNSAVLLLLFGMMGVLFPWLLVRIWNCRPLPDSFLRKRLEDFCRASSFTYTDILVWDLFDGKLITAGVLGFVRKIRYLLISPTLLEILNEEELEAVIAHEIGHVKKRHMLFYLIFVMGYMLFSYVFFTITYFGMLSQDLFFNIFIGSGGKLTTGFSLISMAVLIFFLLVYFRVIFGSFSRNFERQADGYALHCTGTGAGIISSLEKIAAAGSHSRTAPNWHHFSIQERIDHIRGCETNRDLLRRHDKKVSRMVTAYIATLLVLGCFLYFMNNSVLNQSELNLIQKIAEKKIEAEPDNPSLHFLLANIYYEKKLFEDAEKQYLITLNLKPNEPEALNNLAWLYATAEDRRFRKPQEALKLSFMAAELDPQPHILDTLAESYFINGYYTEAIETIKIAISKKPSDMTYFEKQLKKFEEREKNNKGAPSGDMEERLAI